MNARITMKFNKLNKSRYVLIYLLAIAVSLDVVLTLAVEVSMYNHVVPVELC